MNKKISRGVLFLSENNQKYFVGSIVGGVFVI